MATEAAGEGINLQCCHVMVNFDIPWNPCRLEQRMGRIHRYGQEAGRVCIFNLVATNTMEGEVKEALLKKLEQMRRDLQDKVFDVVGSVLWGRELRSVLERVALGEKEAVKEARQIIEGVEEPARKAIEAEQRTAVTAEPLDIAAFQRKQATFRAFRLHPETSEKFFRQAIPFAGGILEEFPVSAKDGQQRPAFEVTLPPELRRGQQRKLTVSFWPEVCSDDETDEKAVLFIAPGHWLFEALIGQVIKACAPDLSRGAVFFDLQPEDESPYLVWFVRSQVRDGLDRRVADLLAAVRHRADEEQVTPLPTEILDGFEFAQVQDVGLGVRQVQPMLAGQTEVMDQCVGALFLPELAERRAQHQAVLARDRRFLEDGLTALAEHLSTAAVGAYGEADSETGDRLADQSTAVQQRLAELRIQMTQAEHLLMVAPEVLGVALVLPAPMPALSIVEEEISLELDEKGPPSGVPMRRDPEVEKAAIKIVMEYKAGQGRYPRDVSKGHSWDIESDDAHGVVVRYIEVKGRGPEDANEVSLTENEWEAARRLGEQHWLYVVRLGDRTMWLIQNPYAKLQPKELKRWIVKVRDVAEQGEAVVLERV